MKRIAQVGIALAVAAVVAVTVVLSVRLLGSDGGAYAQTGNVDLGIDPEVTGNTASTLGTLESCVRVDVAAPAFDNISDYNIDVYVRGDTQAPIAYDAWVTYDPTKVHIAAPGTSTLIKLPGAGGFSDAVPDRDGRFVAGAAYLSGGPGIGGDGALVRLGLDIGGSGVVTFGFDFPAGAAGYVSLSGEHPVTRRAAQLAINQDCPPGGQRAGATPSPSPERGPGATPEAQAVRVRWGKISLVQPDADSGIFVSRESHVPWVNQPEGSGPAVLVANTDKSSTLTIDAETGHVIDDRVRSEDRAAFDAILATVRVEGEGVSGAPWPYGPIQPDGPRRSFGNITYIEPDPASGIAVSGGYADGFDTRTGRGVSTQFLEVYNTRSYRFIDAHTGQVMPPDDWVHPDDREAFDRFTSAVTVVEGG